MEKAETDHLLLLFRQTLDRRTERDALQHAILLPIVTEHVLKREAFVSALALQTFRRSGRGLRLGDLFHAHAAFRGDLGKRRLPAERLLQTAPCRMDLLRALFEPAADLYRAVVAQKATDLPGDLRDNVL